MTRYRKEFIIPYYDTDKKGFIQSAALLTYMGETSSLHSDSLNVGIEELRKHNYGWMLNRWRVRFYKYPRVKERIIVETWNSGIDRFYATREFKIFDDTENLLVNATSQWIFLDMDKKRPKRIPKDFNEIYSQEDEKLLHDYFDFSLGFETDSSLDLNVRKSDIDYNNHVNNVKYLDWMMEQIPLELDNSSKLYELDIHYKKEVVLGNLISSSLMKSEENPTIFLHKISHNSEIHALGRTVWK